MGTNERVALITGAAGGLGAATAFELAQRGHTVYAGVRSLSDTRLAQLESVGIKTILLDVCESGSAEAAVDHILDAASRLDVLVCNAGVAGAGVIEETPPAEFKRVMEVNCFGALRCVQAALPTMRGQGGGLIVAISSLSALIGLPGDGVYAASKAALEMACEALCAEVDRFGVTVRLAQPGAFRTELQMSAQRLESGPNSPYAPLTEQFQFETASPGGGDPGEAARELSDLIEAPGDALRVPIGDQAREIVQKLRALNDGERQSFARSARDSAWWSAGEERPITSAKR
ncbi:MAG: SDR family NAD(P)-dependent oxidoreductase [Pseudomonadota bacterium]